MHTPWLPIHPHPLPPFSSIRFIVLNPHLHISVEGSLDRPWLTLAQLPPPLCSLWWWGSVSSGTDVKSADWASHWIADSPELQTLRRDRGKTDYGALSYGLCTETSQLSMAGHKLTKLLPYKLLERVNEADDPGWCLAAALSLSSSALPLTSLTEYRSLKIKSDPCN